eukprot:scaffold497_cov97-Cylindrotheca_fusiformis.AAC.4
MPRELQEGGSTSKISTRSSVQKRLAQSRQQQTLLMGSLDDSDRRRVASPTTTSAAAAAAALKDKAAAAGKRQQTPKEKRRRAILRYVFQASLACILTAVCPGNTIFWKNPVYYTIQILLIYVPVLLSFFNLQGSDPGFLTNVDLEDGLALLGGTNDMDDDEEDDDESNKNNVTSCTTTTTSLDLPPSPPHAVVEEELLIGDSGASVTPTVIRLHNRKPCEFCHLARPRPLRSYHCMECNKCVATFDHHCGLIDTCIGERNHIRFWIFLLLNVIASRICYNIIATSELGVTDLMTKNSNNTKKVVQPDDDDDDNSLMVLKSVAAVAIEIYLNSIYIATHVLFFFHTYLILAAKTTLEVFKGSDLDYMRDAQHVDCIFSQGYVENIKLQCSLDDRFLRQPAPRKWSPMIWKRPRKIVRDSEDWWNNPWRNKYWQCC